MSRLTTCPARARTMPGLLPGIYAYFWVFGLVNNVLYVVILCAAADLVGAEVPKSLVLLVNILPAVSVKLSAPFFIERVPYDYRICTLMGCGVVGMGLVSLDAMGLRMLGIALASASSGLGEVTFLQFTHYYGERALNGWSSGTGAAGLVGSFLYMLVTTVLKGPVRLALVLFGTLPVGFLLYFDLKASEGVGRTAYTALEPAQGSGEGSSTSQRSSVGTGKSAEGKMGGTLVKIKRLVRPYILPLTLVYLFEYLINQGVSPTLLFPIGEDDGRLPFIKRYRDFYVTYSSLYQLGVFVSRSSGQFVRVRRLYLIALLQGVNLVLAIIQSWFFVIRSAPVMMAFMFYEGLLGGASYVNTYHNILCEIEPAKREFALAAVSMSDSFGISLAAVMGLLLEPRLCEHQVLSGRPWCRDM